jgi:hypothetical protein
MACKECNKKYKTYKKKRLEGCLDEHAHNYETPQDLIHKPHTTPDGKYTSSTPVGTFRGPIFENTNKLYKHVSRKYKNNYEEIAWEEEYSSSKRIIEVKIKNKVKYIY